MKTQRKETGKFLSKEDWLRIANLYASVGPLLLGKEFGVSKQRIQQIATLLRKQGIQIPKIRIEKGHRKEYIEFVKNNFAPEKN